MRAYVYFLPLPAWKPPRLSHGLGLVTGSRHMGLHHIFNNWLVGPSQEADNCQLKTLQQQRAGHNVLHARHPCSVCIAHYVLCRLAATSWTFSWKAPFMIPRTKLPGLESSSSCSKAHWFPSSRVPGGVWLSSHSHCVGYCGSFLPYFSWEGCLKAAWIIWLWLNQASNKWKQGRTHSLILFDSCKHRAKKKSILNADISRASSCISSNIPFHFQLCKGNSLFHQYLSAAFSIVSLGNLFVFCFVVLSFCPLSASRPLSALHACFFADELTNTCQS